MKEKSKGGRPITAKAPWGELYRRMGGQSKLADALGVSTSTVTKWARDVHRVPKLVKKELIKLCDEHAIEEGVSILRN